MKNKIKKRGNKISVESRYFLKGRSKEGKKGFSPVKYDMIIYL